MVMGIFQSIGILPDVFNGSMQADSVVDPAAYASASRVFGVVTFGITASNAFPEILINLNHRRHDKRITFRIALFLFFLKL
jgi:hypothetical protein